MLRRILFAVATASALAAASAHADVTRDVVTQLQGMGYSRVIVERTLLGRVKIDAAGDQGRREIIINPRTGEILRDVFWPLGALGTGQLLASGSSSDRDDRDRDDDSRDVDSDSRDDDSDDDDSDDD